MRGNTDGGGESTSADITHERDRSTVFRKHMLALEGPMSHACDAVKDLLAKLKDGDMETRDDAPYTTTLESARVAVALVKAMHDSLSVGLARAHQEASAVPPRPRGLPSPHVVVVTLEEARQIQQRRRKKQRRAEDITPGCGYAHMSTGDEDILRALGL
jgi:hypothetical protein